MRSIDEVGCPMTWQLELLPPSWKWAGAWPLSNGHIVCSGGLNEWHVLAFGSCGQSLELLW